MKSDLPKSFREGDELTASLINDILEEIWRWRHMEGMPPLHVSEADSDAPPVLSFFDVSSGPFFVGTTGGGYASGSISSPSQVGPGGTGTQARIYYREVNATFDTATYLDTWSAYNIYSSTIASSKTAWYWKSPYTGNYYIVTADC